MISNARSPIAPGSRIQLIEPLLGDRAVTRAAVATRVMRIEARDYHAVAALLASRPQAHVRGLQEALGVRGVRAGASLQGGTP